MMELLKDFWTGIVMISVFITLVYAAGLLVFAFPVTMVWLAVVSLSIAFICILGQCFREGRL